MPSHTVWPAFSAWSGPRDARMVLVGEAWGESEDQTHKPFAGESGKELWKILGEAMPQVAPELHSAATGFYRYGLAWIAHREPWLAAAGIGMTNVLGFRPPGNKLETLCASKAEVGGPSYAYPPLSLGKYLRPEYLPEIQRLRVEILHARPNLVVALGNTACWALLRATNIGSIRGAVTQAVWDAYAGSDEIEYKVKVLPTYHPAGVLRNWSWRPIVVADLMKASREAGFAEIRRPQRRVIVSPTIVECETWTAQTLASGPHLLSCDIETGAGQIKCVGFARSRADALVIPFVDLRQVGGNYWSTAGDEWRAWQCVRALLEAPVPKLFQNGLYDLQYLLRMGFKPAAVTEDTMLLHHSLYPEMLKGLGFLGSVYTNEASWKLMRRERVDSEKRDE